MLQFVLDVFELSLYGFMAFFGSGQARILDSSLTLNILFGKRSSVERTIWPVHLSWEMHINAWILVMLARLRTSISVTLSCHVNSAVFFQHLADIFKPHFMINFSPAISLNWSNHQLYDKEHRILALLSLKANYRKFNVILRRLKARPNSCFILFVPLKDSVHSSRSPGITCRQGTGWPERWILFHWP